MNEWSLEEEGPVRTQPQQPVIPWRGLDPGQVPCSWVGPTARHRASEPTLTCPPPAPPGQAAPSAPMLVCSAHHHLITHCVHDEAERLFGKTATLIPTNPQGWS